MSMSYTFETYLQTVKSDAINPDPILANRFYVSAVEELGVSNVQAITLALADARLELETLLNNIFAAWLIGVASQSLLLRAQDLVRAEYSGAMLDEMYEEVLWRVNALKAFIADYTPDPHA
jgi:hypothetical protein